MKLDFETLQLAGFRSFVQPTTFTLAKPAGLYFIRGKNELEPELEGNGVGKLQPKTLIFETPTGLRRWGDIKVGDLVFSENGTPTPVTRIFENGVCPIYKVTFDDDSYTLVGLEHLWKVCDAKKQNKSSNQPIRWEILTTAQILQFGVNYKNGTKWGASRFYIPIQGAVQYATKDLPIHPYLLGVWLGDGCRGYGKYSKPDKEIQIKLEGLGYSCKRNKQNAVYVHKISKFLHMLELLQTHSYERFIPQIYKYADVEQRKELLNGLLDTDGECCKNGSVGYSTTSPRLAKDVEWLVRSLGDKVQQGKLKNPFYRDQIGTKHFGRPCHRLTISLPWCPFTLPRKAHRWHKPQKRYQQRWIKQIEYTHDEDSMCIQIEHPSQCYLTNDFIVTHNSSLFEAVYWCLFGKTTNGVTAGNISTWGSDKADVTVGLKVNDKAVTIRRARGPNRLQIDGKDVTQDRVIAILGVTPDLVSSAVLIGQFADTFVEKGHAERLAMFSQLLSLDRWDTYSESAKANATHYEQQVRELEAQLSHNQGMREGMNPKQLEKAATDWEASRATNLRSVEETVARTALTLQTVQEELNEKNTELRLLKEVPPPGVFYPPDKPEAEANPALDGARYDAQLLAQTIQTKRYEETKLKKKAQEINELGALCSQCGQVVTGEHKEMECVKLSDELKRAIADSTELENKLKNKNSLVNQMIAEDTNLYLQAVALWQKDCARIKEVAQIAHVQYQKYTAALALIMQAVGNCKMKYLNAMKSQQEATKRLESIRSEVNPFMTQISKMKADIEKIDLKIKKLGENVTETKHLLAELQYWVGGFKKLKLLIVEESLRTLEMAVNDAVVQLGLHGWVIKLDAERELTTGAIKREFVIYVQSPYNEEAVPWESWSGGERQRLRLAMIFGLQTFMQQRTGVTTNLMFLDEPTNWLSNAGVESMLSFLKDKAARDNLAIWLADHRSLDSGEFSHTFLIRKTENGSIIEG